MTRIYVPFVPFEPVTSLNTALPTVLRILLGDELRNETVGRSMGFIPNLRIRVRREGGRIVFLNGDRVP